MAIDLICLLGRPVCLQAPAILQGAQEDELKGPHSTAALCGSPLSTALLDLTGSHHIVQLGRAHEGPTSPTTA